MPEKWIEFPSSEHVCAAILPYVLNGSETVRDTWMAAVIPVRPGATRKIDKYMMIIINLELEGFRLEVLLGIFIDNVLLSWVLPSPTVQSRSTL